jgi:hypothetical protein
MRNKKIKFIDIDNLLNIKRSDLRDDLKVINDTCFCMKVYDDNDSVRILPCKHSFHTSCIDKWLLFNNIPTCPTCRVNILSFCYNPKN